MKHILASILAMTVFVCILCNRGIDVKASARENINESYLLQEEYSEGDAVPLARGIYLKSGLSRIKKSGTGQIAAGGNTVGQTTIDKLGITVEVQRLVDGSWKTYTTWSVTEYGVPIVTTSKVLNVPKGYYYRVRCTHHANSDVSGSYTDGIYI